MLDALPVRVDGVRPDRRPAGLVVPPARMPLVHAGRPVKRWRYLAAFSERWMLCAAEVRIGPAGQCFWAVWDRERGVLDERTHRRPGAVRFGPGARVRVGDGAARLDLVVDPAGARPVETVSPHGRAWIWTRKLGGARVRGTVTLGDGARHDLDARGVVDESAGYHARHTAWRWSAGVGADPDGVPLAWNLVDGVHDAPETSERTVWVDGLPVEAPPVRFAGDLGTVTGADGAVLRFAAEATRAHRDELFLVASDYAAPFGTFTGTLPGGVALAHGLGVMERHEARW